MGRKKLSEMVDLSDDAIGIVTITLTKNNSVCIYMDADVLKEIDCDTLIFNRHNKTIRPATLDENGHKINSSMSGGTSTFKINAPEELPGRYELVKEDKVYKLYDIQ